MSHRGSRSRVHPSLELAHLHTCQSWASGEMCRAFLTSGEFRYMLRSVELVQGGSIRTFRAAGIRNRLWERIGRVPAAAAPTPSPPAPYAGDTRSLVTRVPRLTCRQENLVGTRMKELPRSCVMR